MKSLFPMFVKLEDRQVLVVGAGKIGEQKISGLLQTGAHILVVAPNATDLVAEWARERRIQFESREYSSGDLEGKFLVIVAAGDRDLNQRVYNEAQGRGVLCNVVDVPEQCDFYYPSVVKRGDLQIAISTTGQSPSLAQRIRHQLEQQFGPAYEAWVAELGSVRREILNSGLSPDRKRSLLQSLASRTAFEAELLRQQSESNGGAV
jgi:precorrin-2 dehydrogenase / sirohydrochlorin ferrochelatase